jgi:predicted phage-related endonuclease
MMAEKLVPKDRADWLTLRKPDVTASQIAAVVGSHPYVSAYQLWAEKTGKLVNDANLDSPAMRRGRLLESVAADLAAEAMPGAIVEHNASNCYWRDGTLRIGATPDLLVKDTERGDGTVQLKSVEPSIYARNWENGEPPLWIALQALTEAKLTGAQWAAVGALRVSHGVDFDLVPIPLHAGAWQALVDAVGAFWRSVETDTPPQPDYSRDGAVIAAMHPASSGSSIDLSGDNELIVALAEREEAKALAKDLDAQLDRLDAMIRHKIGDHETALAQAWRVTLKTEQRKGYTVAESTRRPIRVKRLKEPA